MVECGVAPLLDTPHSLHRSRLMVDHFPVWADRIQYWHIDDMDCATADEAATVRVVREVFGRDASG